MDLLSFGLAELIVGVTAVILILYKLGTRKHNLFRSRGIRNDKPLPFLGSLAGTVFRTRSLAYIIEDVYKTFKGDRLVGMFLLQEPMLVVRDPELIRRIAVKDFDHFVDHQQSLTEQTDPMFGKSLFSLRGERWRDMRTTLSPAFTSSKMKAMFSFMNDCGQQLREYLQEEINKQGTDKTYTVEMKDLFSRFANDVVATSAFGIHVDSLKEKDNLFHRMGKELTDFTGIKSFMFLGILFAPKLMKLLGITVITKKERNFFTDLVHHTISTREKEGIMRPDMIHLLMQARRGELTAGEGEEEGIARGTLPTKKIDLSEDDIAAQAMLFFFGGFDTSSTLLSFASILLAVHEQEQRKLQDELDEIMGDDSNLTYEKVQKMKYLDMVISETLRLYPPMISSDRLCTRDYTIPASGDQPEYTVKEGEAILLPTFGIQRDPEYFPDPEKFDPERFSDENKHNINPYAYFPFGLGPRVCIGQRFALLEAKVALIHVLSRFDLTVVEKTPLPLVLSKQGFAMTVQGGFWIGLRSRQNRSS